VDPVLRRPRRCCRPADAHIFHERRLDSRTILNLTLVTQRSGPCTHGTAIKTTDAAYFNAGYFGKGESLLCDGCSKAFGTGKFTEKSFYTCPASVEECAINASVNGPNVVMCSPCWTAAHPTVKRARRQKNPGFSYGTRR
jgi:hypothetical protein